MERGKFIKERLNQELKLARALADWVFPELIIIMLVFFGVPMLMLAKPILFTSIPITLLILVSVIFGLPYLDFYRDKFKKRPKKMTKLELAIHQTQKSVYKITDQHAEEIERIRKLMQNEVYRTDRAVNSINELRELIATQQKSIIGLTEIIYKWSR